MKIAKENKRVIVKLKVTLNDYTKVIEYLEFEHHVKLSDKEMITHIMSKRIDVEEYETL